MRIKFNPTGTHIHKGKLKIRLDFFPDPHHKTYAEQYIDVFTRKLTEEENEKVEVEKGLFVLTETAKQLRKLIPTKKQLNPFLFLFVSVDSNLTKQDVRNFINKNFNNKDIDNLDDIIFRSNRNDLLDAVQNKIGRRYAKSFTEEDIQILNNRLSGLVVVK